VTVSLDGLEGQACYKAEAGERRCGTSPTVSGAARSRLRTRRRAGDGPRAHHGRARGRPFGVGSLQWWLTTTKRTLLHAAEHPSSTTGSPRSRPSTWWRITPTQGRSRHLRRERCWHRQRAVLPRQDKLRTVIWSTRARRQRSFARADRSLRERDTGHVGDWLNQSSWRSRRVARADWWRTRRTRSRRRLGLAPYPGR